MNTKSGKGSEDGRGADLTPAMFHILLALADGQRHGYAIMQEVERATHGEMRLPPGTLYRSIKRLLGDGLIEEASAPAGEESDDERRRYYGITTAGHAVAVAEARRLADIVGLARSKKLLDGRESA